MMMISMNKKYRTRDGREVRIYALDGNGSHTVHGAIKYFDKDIWVLARWDTDGRISSYNFHADLIEVKQRIKRMVWVNVYPDWVSIYLDKKNADYLATPDRIACVRLEIDCEEGEGM
jgi:hypothetical protein